MIKLDKTNMILFMHILLCTNKIIKINDRKELVEYKKYCSSHYKRPGVEDGMKLDKVLIFHRHGDRSALELKGTNWDVQKCKKCDKIDDKIGDCKDVNCEAGLLTLKGYEQMRELGKFIRNSYPEDILSKMYKRATSIPRTQSSIHGVLNGIFPGKPVLDLHVNDIDKDHLMIPKDCPYINSKITDKGVNSLSLSYKEDETLIADTDDPKRRADGYLTALCNEIELSCDIVNCDIKIITNYIKRMGDQWYMQTQILGLDEDVLGLTFGLFVNELLECLNDEAHSSFIFSAHDKSVSMIAVGLGVQEYEHPSYAAAIFLEMYSKDNKKYFRIVYNDKVVETSIDERPYIPYGKFMKYINTLKKSEEDYKKACTEGMFSTLDKKTTIKSLSSLNSVSL